MIKPTVGRVVWYTPSPYVPSSEDKQPLAAIIAYVHNDRLVNLAVFDTFGAAFSQRSVLLLQDGDERPEGNYCEWMPYQKGQAAKTEMLESQLKGVA